MDKDDQGKPNKLTVRDVIVSNETLRLKIDELLGVIKAANEHTEEEKFVVTAFRLSTKHPKIIIALSLILLSMVGLQAALQTVRDILGIPTPVQLQIQDRNTGELSPATKESVYGLEKEYGHEIANSSRETRDGETDETESGIHGRIEVITAGGNKVSWTNNKHRAMRSGTGEFRHGIGGLRRSIQGSAIRDGSVDVVPDVTKRPLIW